MGLKSAGMGSMSVSRGNWQVALNSHGEGEGRRGKGEGGRSMGGKKKTKYEDDKERAGLSDSERQTWAGSGSRIAFGFTCNIENRVKGNNNIICNNPNS